MNHWILRGIWSALIACIADLPVPLRSSNAICTGCSSERTRNSTLFLYSMQQLQTSRKLSAPRISLLSLTRTEFGYSSKIRHTTATALGLRQRIVPETCQFPSQKTGCPVSSKKNCVVSNVLVMATTSAIASASFATWRLARPRRSSIASEQSSGGR